MLAGGTVRRLMLPPGARSVGRWYCTVTGLRWYWPSSRSSSVLTSRPNMPRDWASYCKAVTWLHRRPSKRR
jgi:hypothetical protein